MPEVTPSAGRACYRELRLVIIGDCDVVTYGNIRRRRHGVAPLRTGITAAPVSSQAVTRAKSPRTRVSPFAVQVDHELPPIAPKMQWACHGRVTAFAEIVGDDFPVAFHSRRILSLLLFTQQQQSDMNAAMLEGI